MERAAFEQDLRVWTQRVSKITHCSNCSFSDAIVPAKKGQNDDTAAYYRIEHLKQKCVSAQHTYL